jgi:hypothetical protein
VFEETKREDVPEGSKILTSTWAMKKKADGTQRARINARGYEQVDGVHYDESKAAPVVNDTTFRIVMVLMVMASFYAIVNDVKGAFLHGDFEPGERLFMDVPEGFEKFYPGNVVLLLLKTLYGTKQGAIAFWKKLLEAMYNMGLKRSPADPCLYFQWTKLYGLLIWISWVDDCLCVGKPQAVEAFKVLMSKEFDCDELGELKEYVGCKVDYKMGDDSVKLMQPVLLQSFKDEFDLKPNRTPKTPAIAGNILKRGAKEEYVCSEAWHLPKRCWEIDPYDEVDETRYVECDARVVAIHVRCNASTHGCDASNHGVLCGYTRAWSGIETRHQVGWRSKFRVYCEWYS